MSMLVTDYQKKREVLRRSELRVSQITKKLDKSREQVNLKLEEQAKPLQDQIKALSQQFNIEFQKSNAGDLAKLQRLDHRIEKLRRQMVCVADGMAEGKDVAEGLDSPELVDSPAELKLDEEVLVEIAAEDGSNVIQGPGADKA